MTDSAEAAPVSAPVLERSPSMRRERAGVGWDVVLILAIVVLGFELLLLIGGFILDLVAPVQAQPIGVLDESDILFARVFLWLIMLHNLFLFAGVPFLWLLGTRHKPLEGAIEYLHLQRFGRSAVVGTLLGIGLVALMIGLSLLLQVAFPDMPRDPNEAAFTQTLNVPLIIGISIIAGVSEEIFFRGVVQKKLGVWLQADLFALLHLSQGPIGVFVTLLIGLLFGWLVQRGHSLWLVIVAHAVYDLIILSLAATLGASAWSGL